MNRLWLHFCCLAAQARCGVLSLSVRWTPRAMLPLLLLTPASAQDSGDTALARSRTHTTRDVTLPPLRIPERRPSTGLSWSRRHCPSQFGEQNRCEVELEGLDDRVNERFIDAAGSAYSRAFVSAFSYTDPTRRRPSVKLEYLRCAETFIGTITALGLKPNFVYQLKLRGVPEHRASCARIGRLGRWRLPARLNVYPDPDPEEFLSQQGAESYLFFDFLLTDAHGQATKAFYADSSLHVMATSRQAPPGGWHTRPVVLDRAGSNPDIYVNPLDDSVPVNVFAESEAVPRLETGVLHRPRVGEAYLAPGDYAAELVLTEESFHWYGDGGNWATVMRAPVRIQVVERPRPSPYWQRSVPVARPLSVAGAQIRGVGGGRCRGNVLTGIAEDNDPVVLFAETVKFPETGRYCLGVELLVTAEHHWQVAVYSADDFGDVGSYTVRSAGHAGWRRFELELTSMVLGRRIRLRVDPSMKAGAIGVRNVSFHRIETD